MIKYPPFHDYYPDEIVQFVEKFGWEDFTEVQKKAIGVIPINPEEELGDYIISSETASGKTEAVYLPLIARMLNKNERKNGILYLYISPLIALINDQYSRLTKYCQEFSLLPIKWHSGAGTNKTEMDNSINGILLTTPESLEGFLLRSGRDISEINKIIGADAIIIDELHSYFDNARGRHLQSLLCRLEDKAGRKIPRFALSATLGQALDTSCEILRPKESNNPTVISTEKNSNLSSYELKVFIDKRTDIEKEENENSAFNQTVNDIWKDFSEQERGLIFANSRSEVELIHERINSRPELTCIRESENMKITPFARHHSSVPRREKLYVEKYMRGDKDFEIERMTTICTNTLELGIDIGKVSQVGQIASTFTVSSLRQRVGRSGRTDNKPRGIIYVSEKDLLESGHPLDRLRVSTFQAAATINLSLIGQFEAPNLKDLHLSTLVHQIILLIHEKGAIETQDAYKLLVKNGPWDDKIIDEKFFYRFLESLTEGDWNLLDKHDEKENMWVLSPQLPGKKERRRPRYAVFSTPPEYSVVYRSGVIGKLPMTIQYNAGDTFVLNMGRWKIQTINDQNRVITVTPTSFAGAPRFGGSAQTPSGLVVEEMHKLYLGRSDYNGNSNDNTKICIEDGRKAFDEFKLNENSYLSIGNSVLIFPWCGARHAQTLLLLLRKEGLRASTSSFVINVEGSTVDDIKICIQRIIKNIDKLELDELARESLQLCSDRYDRYLIPYHQRLAFSKRFLDNEGIEKLLVSLLK